MCQLVATSSMTEVWTLHFCFIELRGKWQDVKCLSTKLLDSAQFKFHLKTPIMRDVCHNHNLSFTVIPQYLI